MKTERNEQQFIVQEYQSKYNQCNDERNHLKQQCDSLQAELLQRINSQPRMVRFSIIFLEWIDLSTSYIIQWRVTYVAAFSTEMACTYCHWGVWKMQLFHFFSGVQSHNQIYFWWLIGQTLSSIPVKITAIPVCMAKLLAALCFRAFLAVFRWQGSQHQKEFCIHPATNAIRLVSYLRYLKNSFFKIKRNNFQHMCFLKLLIVIHNASLVYSEYPMQNSTELTARFGRSLTLSVLSGIWKLQMYQLCFTILHLCITHICSQKQVMKLLNLIWNAKSGRKSIKTFKMRQQNWSKKYLCSNRYSYQWVNSLFSSSKE